MADWGAIQPLLVADISVEDGWSIPDLPYQQYREAMSPDQARTLIVGFTNWVREQCTCRALAVAGSWANEVARSTSDLDLFVLTDDFSRWTVQGVWLSELVQRLGFPCSEPVSETHGAATSWRAWLGCDVELELTFAGLDWARTCPIDPGTRRVVSDGIRVLVDKDSLLLAITEAVRKVG
jgi:hypothetical protein